MIELTLEELKQRVIDQMDPDALIECLGVSMEDLVEALSYHIEENYVKVKRALPDDDF